VNVFTRAYRRATYDDLRWMAGKIARIDGGTLRKFIAESGWPEAVAELYFEKLANRRAEILRAFSVPDPTPIPVTVREDAKIDDVYYEDHPEGLVDFHGRFRNYGR
jgi:hypothetical protein